jgi:hypothetical protein
LIDGLNGFVYTATEKAKKMLFGTPVAELGPQARRLSAAARSAIKAEEMDEEFAREQRTPKTPNPSQGELIKALVAPRTNDPWREFPSAEEATHDLVVASAALVEAEDHRAAVQYAVDELHGARDTKRAEIEAVQLDVRLLTTDREKALRDEATAFRAGTTPTVDVGVLDRQLAQQKRRLAVLEQDIKPHEVAATVVDEEMYKAEVVLGEAQAAVNEARFNIRAVEVIERAVADLAPLLGTLEGRPARTARRRTTYALQAILDRDAVVAAIRTR